MRGTDYVVKRVLFAIGTVFVAITLNFVLFRSLSGDAVSALRCRGARRTSRSTSAETLGLDKSKWEQYQIYLGDLAHGDMGRSLRTEEPVHLGVWEPIKTPCRWSRSARSSRSCSASPRASSPRGGGHGGRQGCAVGGLGFYSMPPQWLGLVIVLFIAGWLGLPTSRVKDRRSASSTIRARSRWSPTGSST